MLYDVFQFMCRRFARWQRQMASFDLLNPVTMCILSLLGIAFMYSIQKDSSVLTFKWKTQVLWLVLGSCVYCITAHIHYKIFFQNAHWFYIASLFLLLLLFTPLGKTLGGSRRWLSFGFITLQPSDFSKIATLLMVSSLLTRVQMTQFSESFSTLLYVFALSGFSFFLIFLQPDLGSAMVLPAMVLGVLFVSRLSLRFFFAFFYICLLGIVLISADTYAYFCKIKQKDTCLRTFLPLKDYQRNRILAFAVPSSIDPNGVHVGWHLKQSLIAIGSGGLFGKGWTKNTQAKLGYLPKAASLDDFIFSVLAEETGLFGTYFVLVFYLILIFNTLRIAMMARDRFGCYLGVGVAIMTATHMWINIGMTLGIMPITGVPLPFLSYGGSFMLISFFSQGLVQSVYRFRFAE